MIFFQDVYWVIVLSASVILSSASFSFAAHLSRIAFIWAEASAFVFASFSSAFLALLFDFPVNQSATPCAVPFTMPSAFTWSDSDRFSISSSSVCFLSWRSLLFPQCFGHPLGLFTLCHDFILSFCNASSSFCRA